MFNLGVLFYDLEACFSAFMWWNIELSLGDGRAGGNIGAISRKMTPSQIVQAQALS